jgi:hypothetical protein
MKNILSALTLVLSLSANLLHADFTPIAGWDQQIFPSYVLGTATVKGDGEKPKNHLGDSNGVLGVEVVAPSDNAVIEVTVECDEFITKSSFSGKLPNKGETYQVFPTIKYKYEKLSQCRQATPATVSYRVKVGKSTAEEESKTVTFRPISDCPMLLKSGDDVVDLSFTFAVYVNEQHPYLDKLYREALDIGIVEDFTGYQTKEHVDVLRQVYSIWDLLVARDVRYSSITKTVADSNEVFSQHVRLLEDSINNQQANCVDGSVLIASMLRKIDIESFLVLVPGHCYVGFYLDEDRNIPLAIETTLLGADTKLPDSLDEVLDAAVPANKRGAKSWPSFVHAIESATESFGENKEKFLAEDQSDYKVIDIAVVRSIGVLPIPFRSKDRFVAFDHEKIDSQAVKEYTEEGYELFYNEEGHAYYLDESGEEVLHTGTIYVDSEEYFDVYYEADEDMEDENDMDDDDMDDDDMDENDMDEEDDDDEADDEDESDEDE